MQIVKNVLSFVNRTVFVYVLGAEYLGVNSLFTDILTVLSFAELGIGNAMAFSLYKPLAGDDRDKIKSLMKLYARSYKIIGIVIALLGICVIPFLKYIVGDVSYISENLTVLYLLFILNSVLSYFFVYKKSLIIADQKNYIVDVYQQVFYAIQVVAQSVFLVITRQFIVYLLIMIGITFINNVFVARKADRMYPCLLEQNVKQLEKKEIHDIVTNIKALVVYKIGGIILESSDSILISLLVNVATVGFYSNYKMVINVFHTIGNQIMSSIIASVGNLNASDNVEKKEKVFYELLYVNGWFFGFSAMGLCFFITPLINLWFGSSYVIGFDFVIAACAYFYISSMHFPCYTYRTTAGLFVYGKYVPIISAVCNILLDILMGMKWGLAGILWASTVSRTITYEIIDPFLIYRRIFYKPVAKYFLVYVCIAVFTLLDGFISYKVANFITLGEISGFIVKVAAFSFVYNGIFLVITFKSKPAQSIYKRIKMVLSRSKDI